ncbi:MAG: S-layer family protein, partial [Deltaproteobacteria bacterium]|nr:S-layer family protein [Deltaproteobacteria bacterium]
LLTITVTELLELLNGGGISTRSEGGGDAGKEIEEEERVLGIEINAEEVSLSANSLLTSTAENAVAGDIDLNVLLLVYLLDSKIKTDSNATSGKGGNLTIGQPHQFVEFVILNSSDLITRAPAGFGGDITIYSQYFLQSLDSMIDASGALSNGSVTTTAPDVDVTSGLLELSGSFFDAESWVVERCAVRSGAEVSRFVLVGRGGVPMAPDDNLLNTFIGLGLERGESEAQEEDLEAIELPTSELDCDSCREKTD